MRRVGIIGAALALGVTVACQHRSTPQAELPPLPETWQGQANADAVTPGWIAQFADPELTALVREGLAANHDLAASAARVEAAWAEARISGADRSPQIQASGSAVRTRTQNIGFVGGPVEVDSFQIGVSASWELDIWGRLRDRARGAGLSAQAAAADRDAAERSLAGQVAKAWYAARSAQAEVALSTRLAAIQQQSVTLAERRVQAGLVDIERVREIRSALAAAENRTTTARLTLASRIRQLEILLGRYPAGNLACPASLPPLPDPPAAGIPAALVANRPDVHALELRLRAALARADAAQADLYPRLSLTASAGRSSSELSDLLDHDFTVWSFGGNILQPLLQGGRLRANRDRIHAEAQATSEQFAQTVLFALGEVETALITGTLLAERDAGQRIIVAEATALAERSLNRQKQGLGDALAALSAERGRLEAELSALNLTVQQLTNRIDLHLALGSQPLPVESTP